MWYYYSKGPATTGKKSLGVSDLIDKDTRAQGRSMTLEEEGAKGA